MRHVLAFLLSFLMLVAPISPWVPFAHAAVPVCANYFVNYDGAPAGTTHTFSVTNPGGSDLVLLVAPVWRDISETLSTVTYGGDTVTVKGQKFSTSANNTGMAYRTATLKTGANDVVVTYTGTPLASALQGAWCTGVDTTGDPFSDFNTNSGTTGTTATLSTVTSPTGELLIDAVGIDITGTAGPNVGADQTALGSAEETELMRGMSYQGAGFDDVMTWTWTNNDDWTIVGGSLKAAATADECCALYFMSQWWNEALLYEV